MLGKAGHLLQDSLPLCRAGHLLQDSLPLHRACYLLLTIQPSTRPPALTFTHSLMVSASSARYTSWRSFHTGLWVASMKRVRSRLQHDDSIQGMCTVGLIVGKKCCKLLLWLCSGGQQHHLTRWCFGCPLEMCARTVCDPHPGTGTGHRSPPGLAEPHSRCTASCIPPPGCGRCWTGPAQRQQSDGGGLLLGVQRAGKHLQCLGAVSKGQGEEYYSLLLHEQKRPAPHAAEASCCLGAVSCGGVSSCLLRARTAAACRPGIRKGTNS